LFRLFLDDEEESLPLPLQKPVFKEPPKPIQKEPPREIPSRESLKDVHKESPKEFMRDSSKDFQKEPPKESHKELQRDERPKILIPHLGTNLIPRNSDTEKQKSRPTLTIPQKRDVSTHRDSQERPRDHTGKMEEKRKELPVPLPSKLIEEVEIEKILDQRTVNGRQELYIKWKNLPDMFCTWERKEELLRHY